MNRLILAIALLFPVLAWAGETRCVAVQLTLENNNFAVLDMRGRWVVNSWTDVEKVARQPDGALLECLAQGLLAQRATISRNGFADYSCPADIQSFGEMEPIIRHDPIMRLCQPSPRCDPGDTCS
jgi:hypothetical protein